MNPSLAAASAFFGLGANVLGAIVLVLLSPRNRQLSWYLPFQFAIVLWLATLGMGALTGDWESWRVPHFVAVYLMPALFISFALADSGRPTRWLLAPVGVALTLIAIVLLTGEPRALGTTVLITYHVVGWATGGLLLWRRFLADPARRPKPGREARLVTGLLVLFIPAFIIGGLLVGTGFFVYVMPVATVFVLVLVFTGIVRHRFYDIEVRLLRSGELASRAAERERLAVLGELAATVAHEVRNPLAGLQSLAQRLAEEDVDEARRRRYGALMLDEARRLERIVSNLLGLARRADGGRKTPPAVTALPELFDDLRLLAEGIARSAGVVLTMQADAAVAPAPREPLAQVLLNLMLNAVHHSPRGGHVTVTASADGEHVALTVTDQGQGVRIADRERIFDAFHTGSGGTGLGLAVVRRIANERGWRIEVADHPGGGAAFRILLAAPPHVPAQTR
jgi:signal transduction histidine kinase